MPTTPERVRKLVARRVQNSMWRPHRAHAPFSPHLRRPVPMADTGPGLRREDKEGRHERQEDLSTPTRVPRIPST
jgi:hypothetical protein